MEPKGWDLEELVLLLLLLLFGLASENTKLPSATTAIQSMAQFKHPTQLDQLFQITHHTSKPVSEG
jgi:hypothetical protein